jgi:hypothetical protein
MKSLSEISLPLAKPTENTLADQDTLANMPARGLTSEAGRTITAPEDQPLTMAARIRLSERRQQLTKSSPEKSSSTPLASDEQGRLDTMKAISLLFNGLKTYGKDPGQLDAVIDLFMFALADYSAEQVAKAFRQYVLKASDFPAPADIVQLIERDGRPPLDKAVYLQICKKDPMLRSRQEWDYKAEFERTVMEDYAE